MIKAVTSSVKHINPQTLKRRTTNIYGDSKNSRYTIPIQVAPKKVVAHV